jgi:hypothetical protein
MAYIHFTSWYIHKDLDSSKASTVWHRLSCFVLRLRNAYQWPFLEGNISVGCCCQILQKVHHAHKQFKRKQGNKQKSDYYVN